jgi:hypothetical protein
VRGREFTVFHLSNAVNGAMARAHFLDPAGSSVNRGTRVSSEDCGDEGTIGSNR